VTRTEPPHSHLMITANRRLATGRFGGPRLASATILRDVWRSRLRRVAALLAVVAGSQLGHAIAYFARFGLDSGRHESAGVHGYYPALTAGLGAVVGVVLLTSLAVVAVARGTLLSRAGYLPRGTARFRDVLPAVFVAQLTVFAGQETVEALAAGHLVPSAAELLLWGALGQLPAAAIAASVICWLLTRLEAAWAGLVDGVRPVPVEPALPAAGRVTRAEADARLRLGSAFPSAFRRRGPPLAAQT
jgi:hypothetical protein